MHDPDFDINLDEISKIEGAASLSLKVRDNRLTELMFSISEWKRFYTQAVRNKPAAAVPQLVARICGTCSNAHLLAAIKAVEQSMGIEPTAQTKILRELLYHGLIIRDHALHLYIFTLPDYLSKDSILDFDEKDPLQHELLDDTFAIKEVGNRLSIISGGRSVHAPFALVGGFAKLPTLKDLQELKPVLEQIRPKIIKLIGILAQDKSQLEFHQGLVYSALVSSDYSYLYGQIKTSKGEVFSEKHLGSHLQAKIIPYSQARGFSFDGEMLMVGALARLNLNQQALSTATRTDLAEYLKHFPSNNLYLNNLAQAIEIVNSIDKALEIIAGLGEINPEKPQTAKAQPGQYVSAIEAPRGTLYYRFDINEAGLVEKGEIIVPTGQNQVLMEKSIAELVSRLLTQGNNNQEEIIKQVETLIRAYDPCMSCAAHFLKVNWK